jgi:hypothetical protein
MIELTVGLPLYNAGMIAPLALEGLMRQESIDFEWELIVAEEQGPKMFGEINIDNCMDNLRKVGCSRLIYIPLYDWVSLGEKWKLIANKASSDSKAFLLQAGDSFAQPYRLKSSHQALVEEGYDWYKSNIGLFYNIRTEKTILYNDRELKQGAGINIGMLTKDIINKVPNEFRRAIVDGWLYNNIKPQKVYTDISMYFVNGVDTHGYHNISHKRGKFFEDIKFPFEPTILRIEDNLPEEIVKFLKSLK